MYHPVKRSKEDYDCVLNVPPSRSIAVRWQAKRDTAVASAGAAQSAKAPSPLRCAGALHIVVLCKAHPDVIMISELLAFAVVRA